MVLAAAGGFGGEALAASKTGSTALSPALKPREACRCRIKITAHVVLAGLKKALGLVA